MKRTFPASVVAVICALSTLTSGFQTVQQARRPPTITFQSTSDESEDLSSLLTDRFPTSVEDQVRQASEALRRASKDDMKRHSVRLLLPLIGATELDDWPGGARQMMEAASPLMQDVLKSLGATEISQSIVDASDGVCAMMAQATEAKDDSCTVLLPSSDTVGTLKQLDGQVGPNRNLILVNAQWKRKSDFGFFGRDGQISYIESFEPTFYCGNLIVEGDQVRILRSYPGPWRVFLREEADDGSIQWNQIGQKDVVAAKPAGWDSQPSNSRDGGRLFDYGQPTYEEITNMITSMEGYQPKSLSERAAAAFTFIKDTL